MSSKPTISVFVGQCGNQLGYAYLDKIATAALHSHDRGQASARGEPSLGNEQYARTISATSFRTGQDQQEEGVCRPVARAVLVDMEPKVMEQSRLAAAERRMFVLDAAQCVSREEGSANNWAFGFFAQGNSRLDAIDEKLRAEVIEAEENHGNGAQFHVVHSVAGGTGSGVGSLISERISELYPKSILFHTIVWPFSHGEVVTQWYNTMLATSHLRDTVDGCLVLSNDDVAADITSRHEGGGVDMALQLAEAASFRDMNDVMATQMSSLLLPSHVCEDMTPLRQEKRTKALMMTPPQPRSGGGGGAAGQSACSSSAANAAIGGSSSSSLIRCAGLDDIVESAVGYDPITKFFSGMTFPRNPGGLSAILPHSSWQAAVSDGVRTAARLGMFSCLFVLRGSGASTEGLRELRHDLSDAHAAVSLPPTSRRSALLEDIPFDARLLKHDSSNGGAHVSLFGPSTTFADKLAVALEKAEGMLEAKAFVHHFERYGVAEDDLHDACVRCWELEHAYRSF